jgi:hypothetical protein
VAKNREKLAVNEQGSHRFNTERFNLKKLNEVDDKEKYRIEVSNRFAALEDSDAEVEINTIWETVLCVLCISLMAVHNAVYMTEHIPCILCIPLNAVSLNTLVLHSLYH